MEVTFEGSEKVADGKGEKMEGRCPWPFLPSSMGLGTL